MSLDYFGALLRSAGHAMTATPAVMQAAGDDLVEFDVEREAPRPEARREATPAPAPSRTSALPPVVAPVALQRADGELPPLPFRDTQSPATHDVPSSPQTPLVDASPPLHAVVHAALTWVAADPRMRAMPGTSAQEDPPPPAAFEPSTPAQPAEDASEEIEHLAPAHADAPDTLPAQRPRNATRATSERRARSSTPAAPPREEVIEISIGAIHLRVDAPAPQTIVAAPAPAPAAAPVRAPTPRSPLSRRALYRL
jgi:hypothetical protein